MKWQCTLLFMMTIPVIFAWPLKTCPDLPQDTAINISTNQLKGEWKVVATKPQLGTKCKNITITVTSEEDSLHEDYFSRLMYFWHKRSSNDYRIVKQIKTPVLKLKNKAWYSIESKKMTLIGVDYATYAIFYSCSSGILDISETYELWTRDEVNTNDLPQGINDSLAKFNVKPEDLKFRTQKDCSY